MKPLVSILIPAYNAEETIAYAIQSALAQTWPRREIIVINDGSTDRTGEIVQRFASQEVLVISSENRGARRRSISAIGMLRVISSRSWIRTIYWRQTR